MGISDPFFGRERGWVHVRVGVVVLGLVIFLTVSTFPFLQINFDPF